MKKHLLFVCVFLLSPFCSGCNGGPGNKSTPLPNTTSALTHSPALINTDIPKLAPITLTTTPFDIGTIAFVSDRDGNEEIYTIHEDGSGPRRLTENPERDYHPGWSPNGLQITFTSERDGYAAVYLMNADGSNQRPLARGWNPFWSPDGNWIAFQTASSQDYPTGSDLHIIAPDGSDEQTIMVINVFGENISILGWMDDSQGVMINKGGTKQGTVGFVECIIDIYGNNMYGNHNCSSGCSIDMTTPIECPPESYLDKTHLIDQSMSSDGLVSVLSDESSGNFEVYVIDALGDYKMNISNHPAKDYQPVWSPGDAASFPPPVETQIPTIAFVSDRDGNEEIYLINLDGSGLQRLTFDPARDCYPSWSPDGRQIAFTKDDAIYIMNADGSNPYYLTQGFIPFWSPDGYWIAFVTDVAVGGELHIIRPDGTDEYTIMIIPFGDAFNILGWMDSSQALALEAVGPFGKAPAQCLINISRDMNSYYGEECAQLCIGEFAQGCTPKSVFDWLHLLLPWGSPDKKGELWAEEVNGNLDIICVDTGGHPCGNLTNHPAKDYQPVWSPVRSVIAPPLTTVTPLPLTTVTPLPTPTNLVVLWIESIDYRSVTINGFIAQIQGPWIWDWGDGTVNEGWFPQSHTYAECGVYIVTVSTPGYSYTNTIEVGVCKS